MSIKRPFNIWTRKYTMLKRGEKYCPRCKGKGAVEITTIVPNRKDYEFVNLIGCNKCLGEGKIDWVNNAINIKETPPSISYKRKIGSKKPPSIIKIQGKCKINIHNCF